MLGANVRTSFNGGALAAVLACACTNVLGIDAVSREHAPGAPSSSVGPSASVQPAEAGTDAAACGDVTSDPKNCGACGHDCLSGACNAGICAPRVLVRALDTVTTLTVSENYLGWKAVDDDAVIGACRLPECTSQSTVQVPHFDSSKVAVVEPYLYWNSESAVAGDAGAEFRPTTMRCRLESCAATSELAQVVMPRAFLPDAMLGLARATDQNFVRCGLRDGSACAPIAFGVNQDPVAVAGGRVFYAFWNGTERALGSCVDQDCDATRVVHASRGFGQAAARGSRVIFTRAGMLSTCRAEDCEGTRRDLMPIVGDALLAVSDSDAFALATGTASVVACSLEGCGFAPRIVARGVVQARALVADARAIYYFDALQAAIVRVVP